MPYDLMGLAAADLAEARARIEAAREALRVAQKAPGGDLAAIRQAVVRLDRMGPLR